MDFPNVESSDMHPGFVHHPGCQLDNRRLRKTDRGAVSEVDDRSADVPIWLMNRHVIGYLL